jgi:uncharacterized protein YbjT (DUF2867 family)
MPEEPFHVVTGAFGYSGKYITQRLLDKGCRVKTLTNSPDKTNPFGDKVTIAPFNFDKPDLLRESLEGASVLYNTYWVRFNHPSFTQRDAVNNTITMFKAAKEAGIKKVVHVSISNPDAHSPLEYFRSKAQLERALMDSGVSYAILRPTVLFGKEDILINNIAWMLRKFPVFGMFGSGSYRMQPIYVDDLAKLAVEHGQSEENAVIEAIGPETFTFRDMVKMIGEAIGKRRLLMPVPPIMAYLAGRVVGMIVGDMITTRDEIKGLMEEKLYTNVPPTGETQLSKWVQENAQLLGFRYASELAHRNTTSNRKA